jgi:putative transposase
VQQRVANARKNFPHRHSTTVANSHGTVVVEALKVRNMTASAKGKLEAPGRKVRQKAGLNRSILDQGWGTFRIMLRYKLADRGGQLIEVPPAYTTLSCAECGVIDTASRLSQAHFACVGCGNEANADTNAAINILWRARGQHQAPWNLGPLGPRVCQMVILLSYISPSPRPYVSPN